MNFKFAHNNITVFNLERSIEFYEKALGYTVVSEKTAGDGSFKLIFMSDGTPYRLELTWYRDRTAPYELGDNEIHMAVTTDDYGEAYNLHKEMGCICYENEGMGLYFIADPDDYWTEIIRAKK